MVIVKSCAGRRNLPYLRASIYAWQLKMRGTCHACSVPLCAHMVMFCIRNRQDDEERGQQELSEDIALPGSLAQPGQHEEIGMSNRNDSSQSLQESHKQRQDFDEGANDLWSLYGKEALTYDESRIKTLKDDMGSILIFAGLFSAVLTAFVVPKILDLKPDPADQSAYYQNQTVYILDRISQQLASVGDQISTNLNPPLPYPTFHPSASDRRANIFWLLSLVCSLFAAFLATLVQQWSKDYMHIFQQADNPLQVARFRVLMLEGSERLPVLAEVVHGLIHFSLILFFWGLGEIILQIDTIIFVIILCPTTVCVCLYVYCTIAPILDPKSPYRTPFSIFIWFVIRNLSHDPRYSHFHGKEVIEKHPEQYSMEENKSRMNRDVRAIQWLVDRTNGSEEIQALVLAIPSSFEGKWGREVWKRVVGDQSTSLANLQARSHPGFSSARKGTTVYELCRRVRYFFETYKDEGDSTDTGIGRTTGRRRIRGCVETAASLVCCTSVELDLFGDIAQVLSEVGDREQINNSLSIRSNPMFTIRWTCLSLVAIKQIVDDNRLQELAKFTLNGIALLQINLGSRDTVTMALTAAQKMDNDLKRAWEAVLDLRLALEPWSENKNKTESEIRGILNTSSCEASIQELERIAMEAVGLKEIDWRIRYLQQTMEEVSHKLTRRLPGVFFHELLSIAPNMTSKASDMPSTPVPPQLIYPGQQLKTIYILGRRLRNITKRQNTEWDEETLKSLEYLREVPMPLCGLNYLIERQLWRLLDLHDGGGLGFTIELFFLALKQLSSASPSSDESSSSESKKLFYTSTFDIITSNWTKSKDSAGTLRLLLDLLCDLIIQGRGIFSDFRYPPYIVEMFLNLVGGMVEGHGYSNPHVNEVIEELEDYDLRNRMNIVLRNEALRRLGSIPRSLDPVSS